MFISIGRITYTFLKEVYQHVFKIYMNFNNENLLVDFFLIHICFLTKFLFSNFLAYKYKTGFHTF